MHARCGGVRCSQVRTVGSLLLVPEDQLLGWVGRASIYITRGLLPYRDLLVTTDPYWRVTLSGASQSTSWGLLHNARTAFFNGSAER